MKYCVTVQDILGESYRSIPYDTANPAEEAFINMILTGDMQEAFTLAYNSGSGNIAIKLYNWRNVISIDIIEVSE